MMPGTYTCHRHVHPLYFPSDIVYALRPLSGAQHGLLQFPLVVLGLSIGIPMLLPSSQSFSILSTIVAAPVHLSCTDESLQIVTVMGRRCLLHRAAGIQEGSVGKHSRRFARVGTTPGHCSASFWAGANSFPCAPTTYPEIVRAPS